MVIGRLPSSIFIFSGPIEKNWEVKTERLTLVNNLGTLGL